MFLYLVILLFLLLYRVSFSGPEEFQEEHFTKSFELPLRGFFTLVIIYHHISHYLDRPGPFWIFLEAGVLCVAVFFFYSGYGLMKNRLENPNYFRHFFLRRYSKIFIPFFCCNILYLAVYYAMGERYGLPLSLEYLLGIRLINPHAWYVIVIALFYLVFYLCFHLPDKAALILLALFQLAFPTYCMVKGPGVYWFQGEWWFHSSSLFFIGVLMARYEKQIMAFSRKRYYALLLLSAFLFSLLYPASVRVFDQIEALLLNERIFVREMAENWIAFLWQTMAVISFVTFLFFITLKLRFSNRFLIFLGEHSFELYLIHGLYLVILRGKLLYIHSDFCYTLAVLLLSLISSMLISFPFRILAQKIKAYLHA